MKGFTLVETVVVAAIISLIAVISMAGYFLYQDRSYLTEAQNKIVQSLRQTQLLAQASFEDDNWGLKIETNHLTIFKGSSFELRDETYDQKIDLPAQVNYTGLTEVIFNKFSGQPVTTGLIELTQANIISQIRINEKGLLDY